MNTVIHLIHPMHLMDAHLLAEFSALKRVVKLAKKAKELGKTPENCSIPNEYCLGVGHFLFFQDKMKWVRDRILQDFEELESRGYPTHPKETEELLQSIDSFFEGSEWYKHFDPSHDEVYLSMARAVTSVNTHKVNNEIIERSRENPWLKERRVPVLRDRMQVLGLVKSVSDKFPHVEPKFYVPCERLDKSL